MIASFLVISTIFAIPVGDSIKSNITMYPFEHYQGKFVYVKKGSTSVAQFDSPQEPEIPQNEEEISEELDDDFLRAKEYLDQAFDKYDAAEKILKRAQRKLSNNEDLLEDLKMELNRIGNRRESLRFRNDIRFAQKKMKRNIRDYLSGINDLSQMIKELNKLSRELLRI